ncbi:MAG: DNA polymerase III subunit beta [Bdellovibrionota bacterium]|nr:DNA polymerase III subunit beta [Bdellovibrionota bacterium]|tara:strand:- start:243 stop:1358 length:1116 start_codon:yes stop_codon:yes gene_type:complete
MRVKILTQHLKDSLNKVLSVVDKKNTRPILTYILISTNDGQLTFSATDLEVSARVSSNANVESEGQFCVNAKNISDIVRELPQDEILLEIIEGKNMLSLRCRTIHYSLLVFKTDDFPKLAFGNAASAFTLNSKQILEIINRTSHAMSLDETRLNLNGIFLQEVDSIIRAVATDGHRLSLLDTEVQNPKVKSLMSGVIIPKKSINELKKLTESFPESSVEISLDDTFMYVNAENKYFLSVRLIAREYPKYEAVIPPKTTHKLIASKDLFFTAVKRIKIMSNEKSNGVRLHLKKDEMTITANHPSLGEAREKVQVEYSGNEMEIGFNAKYLSDTLSVISEGNVSLELNNELSPVLIKSEKLSGYLGIIMPLKL